MSAVIETIRKEHKFEINRLEKIVIKPAKNIIGKDIDELSRKCYNSFNDLQMNFTKIDNQEKRKEFTLKCYKDTYGFLTFVETEVNPDLYVFLVNNLPSFCQLN